MRDCIKKLEKRVRKLRGAAEGELEGINLRGKKKRREDRRE